MAPAAFAASSAWIALMPLATQAQVAPDAEATLPRVVVTARQPRPLDAATAAGSLLNLTPRETPASIDVIRREQLDARGDASVTDAITRAAGISTLAHPGNSNSSLSARGFTDSTSVMRLYDGLRQYGGIGVSFPFDTWSVDHIEVLRGPASVIHGDGAIGAVVNVVPRKPSRGSIESEVQATAGTEGKRALAFGSGGTLAGPLAYRVDVSTDRSDGWVDRGDSRNRTVSAALQLDATPDLQVTLSHADGKQQPMRYFGTPLVNGALLPAMTRRNYNVEDSRILYEDRWTELSARWAPRQDVAVRSRLYDIRSHRYWRNAEGYAYNAGTGLVDRSDNTEIAHDQTQVGNTTHATYSGPLLGRRNEVAVGFDVNRSTFQHTNNTYTGSSGAVDPYDPQPGFYASDVPFIPRYRTKAAQYALFAEDRFALTPDWTLVAGVRHDHADVQRTDLVSQALAFDRSYANSGWRLGTVFTVSPDLSLYAQYATAADPVAATLMLSQANSAFDVSTGRQLEVGLKQSFWGGQGDWTLAAYLIRKNNLLTRDANDPSLRVQVGQRSSRGLEGTVAVALTGTVKLDANVAVLDARYDDFSESVGGVAVSRNGNVPTDVPEQTAHLGLAWSFLPGWTAGGNVRHVGKRYADNANTLVLPAYTLTDLSLQWKASSATTVSLRGFNVFDRAYVTTAYYNAEQWFVGEGRRVELTLNQRF